MLFLEFFLRYMTVMQIFGNLPYTYNTTSKKLSLSPFKCISTVIVIIFVGTGICYVIERSKHNNDDVSKFSNYLQLASNVVALAAALLIPIVKHSSFSAMLNKFQKLDEKFESLGTVTNYKIIFKKFLVSIASFTFSMIIYTSYSHYATCVRMDTPFWYWATTSLPFVFYGFALFQACAIIIFLCNKCNDINKIILKLSNSYAAQIREKGSALQKKNDVLVSIIPLSESDSNFNEVHSTVSEILNEICDLTHEIENFFGPLFLTSFGAIFTVATIQSYYIIVIIVYASDENMNSAGFNIYSIADACFLVLMNICMLIGSTVICEKISTNVGVFI